MTSFVKSIDPVHLDSTSPIDFRCSVVRVLKKFNKLQDKSRDKTYFEIKYEVEIYSFTTRAIEYASGSRLLNIQRLIAKSICSTCSEPVIETSTIFILRAIFFCRQNFWKLSIVSVCRTVFVWYSGIII